MAAISPMQEDLEFDHGTFDSAGFTSQTLASWQNVAGVIDHTLLKADATREQVENLCDEAIRYRFACAMVNPVWVSTAVSVLAGTGIPVGVVLGFPLGASLVSTLRHEAAALTRLGARELDMVIPIGQLKRQPPCGGTHHPCDGLGGAPPRRHPQGDPGDVPAERGRKAARGRDRHPGGSGFSEDIDRVFDRRRDRYGRGLAARGSRRPLRGEGVRRDPHPHRRARHA